METDGTGAVGNTDQAVAPTPLLMEQSGPPEHRVRFHRLAALRIAAVVPILLVPVFQIGVIVWLILQRTANILYYDEWAYIQLDRQFRAGALSLSDLWAPANEHRIVAYRVITLLFIELTHWNRELEMLFGVLIVLGSLLLVLHALARMSRAPYLALLCLVPFSLSLFSLWQFELWQTTFGAGWFPTGFGVALALWALTHPRPQWRMFILAIAGVAIASLTNAGGLVAWIAFLPALWAAGYRQVRFLTVWCGIGGATIIAYLHGLPLGRSSHTAPIAMAQFILAYLGAPVGAPDVRHAQWIGASSVVVVLVAAAVYWRLRGDMEPLVLWSGCGLFALGFGVLTASGRTERFGVVAALSPRYQSIGVFWWLVVVAVIALLIHRLREIMWQPRNLRSSLIAKSAFGLSCLTVVAISLSLIGASHAGYQVGRNWPPQILENQRCMLDYSAASDRCLEAYYPDPAVIRANAPYLEQRGLTIFHDRHGSATANLAVASASPLFAVDAISTVKAPDFAAKPTTIPQGSAIFVSGWAVDADATAAASAVFITMDGKTNTLAEYGADRSDVAAYFKQAAYRRSGFYALVPTAGVSPGMHRLSIRIISQSAKAAYPPMDVAQVDIEPVSAIARSTAQTFSDVSILGIQASEAGSTNATVITRLDTLILNGWAIDYGAGTVARGVYLSVDDRVDLPLTYFFERPDVSSYFHNPGLVQCGFRMWIFHDQLPLGEHTLSLKIVAGDGLSYYVSSWHMLVDVVA